MNEQTQQIASDIISYVDKRSMFAEENLPCYILTGDIKNFLSEELALDFVQRLQYITTELAKQIDQACNHENPPLRDCSIMFQYIFDRCVEVTYKYIKDYKKIDTRYDIREAFNYYELDIPEYLQLKVTNVVGKIGVLSHYAYNYIVQQGYLEKGMSIWLMPFLYSAASVAFKFTLEMDLDNDSEMQKYLYGD